MWNYNESRSEVTDFMEEVVVSNYIEGNIEPSIDPANYVNIYLTESEREEIAHLTTLVYVVENGDTEENKARIREIEAIEAERRIEALQSQISSKDTFQRVLPEADMFVIGMYILEGEFHDFFDAISLSERTELECWREIVILNGKIPKA